MKILKYIAGFILLAGIIYSCEKDDDSLRITQADAPEILSPSNGEELILLKENANNEAMEITWSPATVNVNTPVSVYSVEIVKSGGDFADAINLTNTTETVYSMTTAQLNSKVIDAGLEPDVSGQIDLRITARIGSSNGMHIPSEIITLSVTPYTGTIDISTTWGVVGDATPNGWDGPDIPFWQTDSDNVFVAYANLTDGEIKFREDNAWDNNYGGENGELINDGPNIEVEEGSYKITIDFNAMTYEIENFSLGIVGDATPNGWDGPDLMMNFDSSSNAFKAVVELADGEIKFRLNNQWNTDWGGNDGVLVPGGDNISVSAGKYVVTVDFDDQSFDSGTYTLEEIPNIWGLVGDATPNGWDGPDIQFQLDYTSDYTSGEGVWYLNNVHLEAGEVKFRADNAWDFDYGGSGTSGDLDQGGPNIPIDAAGEYDIILDLSSLTYAITPA